MLEAALEPRYVIVLQELTVSSYVLLKYVLILETLRYSVRILTEDGLDQRDSRRYGRSEG